MIRRALALLLTATPALSQDLTSATTAEIMALGPASDALAEAGRRHNPEALVTAMCYTCI